MPSRIRVFTVAAFAALTIAAPSIAAPMPKDWHAPAAFLAQAVCIHGHEGAWPDNTANSYFGGMQFLEDTWIRAGGARYEAFRHPGGWHPPDSRHSRPWSSSRDGKLWPFPASPREQLYRAWIIWRTHGGSWSEWGTRGLCGV